jgi:hypothetical protein
VARTARKTIWLGQRAFRLEYLDRTMRAGHVSGNATDTPAFGRLNFIADAANERSSNCIHQAIMF